MRSIWFPGFKTYHLYANGYMGWRLVICLGPLTIFLGHRDTAWWARYRARRYGNIQ